MKALLFAVLVLASAAFVGCRASGEIGDAASNISVGR